MSRTMKDSGVEWIGEISSDWNMIKLKYILTDRNEKNNPLKTENILSLSAERGIFPYSEKTGGGNKAKSDLTAYNLAYPGDIVVNNMNILSGSVGLSNYFGAVSPVYYTFYSNSDDIDINYFYYIFKNSTFQKSLLGLGNGIMMKESKNGKFNTIRMRIPKNKLLSLYFPVPPVSEQTKIANFLDEKTSEIDNIFEKTKQSIEELKAYKQSLITEKVTKGLNSNAPMIDSGIEWIGIIPEDWKVTKLKFLTAEPLQYGANESGVLYRENDIRYIRITDIDENNKLKKDGKLALPYEKANKYLLEDGDILLARSGASVGKSFLYQEEYGPSAFAGYLIKATLKDTINPKFVFYNTLSYSYEEWKNSNFIQSTIQNLSAEKYNNYHLVIPKDKKEQNQIVDYLDERTQYIDKLINKKEKMLKELESYKQSLIYEYVTGKKEVK